MSEKKQYKKPVLEYWGSIVQETRYTNNGLRVISGPCFGDCPRPSNELRNNRKY